MSNIIKMEVELLDNVDLYENMDFTTTGADYDEIQLEKLTGIDVVEFTLLSKSDIHQKLQCKLSSNHDIEL